MRSFLFLSAFLFFSLFTATTHAGLPFNKCTSTQALCESIDAANSYEDFINVLYQIDQSAQQYSETKDLNSILRISRAYEYFAINAAAWRPHGFLVDSYKDFVAKEIPEMKALAEQARIHRLELLSLYL